MQGKIKAAVMVLVCMGMLLVQAVPSRAAENRVCEGGCVEETLWESPETYFSTGETTHKVSWIRQTQCLICGTKRMEQMEKTEGCTWTKYTDLGHQTDQNHRYRLTCGKCGKNQEITITTCEAEWTGRHVTPW